MPEVDHTIKISQSTCRTSFGVSMAAALSLVLAALWMRPGTGTTVYLVALAAAFLILAYLEKLSASVASGAERWIRWSVFFAIALQILVLAAEYGPVSLLGGAGMGTVAVIVFRISGRKWLSWTVAAALAVVLCLVSEFALRRVAPLEAGQAGELPALEKHPTRTFALKPNRRTHLKWDFYDYSTDTNSFGLNSPQMEAERPEPDTLRILVVGDGITMPNGLEYPDAYPMQMEGMLRERLRPRTVQVINAGVTGYSPVEISVQVKELGPLFMPDIVIYQFSPSEFHEVGLEREERLRSYGLIPRYKSRRLRILKSSQLLARFGQASRKLRAVLNKKASGRLHRGLEERYYQANGNPLYAPGNLEKIAFCLGKIKAACVASHSLLLICYVPEVTEVMSLTESGRAERMRESPDTPEEPEQAIDLPFHYTRRIATGLDIPFADVTPYLSANRDRPLYVRKSRHWTREGHLTAAEAILEILLAKGYVRR